MCAYIHIYINVYIYIYIERERERETLPPFRGPGMDLKPGMISGRAPHDTTRCAVRAGYD